MLTCLLYIDPGSGSYLVQVVVAALLGAAFWIKMSWQRIKMFFSEKKEDDPGSDEELLNSKVKIKK